jgi:hypothetical protein
MTMKQTRRSVLGSTARLALWSSVLGPLAKGFVSTALAAEPKPWFLLYKIGGGTMIRCSPSVANATGYQLSPYYSSLESIKNEITFIQGISNRAFIDWLGGDDGGHDAGATGMCGRAPATGEGAKPGEKIVKFVGGPTFDRTIAATLSEGLPLPSVDFAVGNDEGRSVTRTMFWRGPGQPVSQWKDPRLAFSRLFGGVNVRPGLDAGTEDKLEDLVLDNVASQLQATKGLLGSHGQTTMDANLTALSEFRLNSRRLAAQLKDLQVDSRFVQAPVGPDGRPLATTNPLAFPQLLKQFNELAAIVLDLGLTRVVTYQLCDSNGTNFTFPFLNGRQGLTFMGDMHFTYGHEFFERRAHRLVIEQWLSETFVDIITRLKRNTSATMSRGVAVMTHQMEHSPHHRVGLLPAVIAGTAFGKIRTGRFIDFHGPRTGGNDFLPAYAMDRTRTTNELFLSLAQGLGLRIDALGDPRYCQRGPITELLA